MRVGLDLELEWIFTNVNINPYLPAFVCQHIVIVLPHSSSHQVIHDLIWKVGGNSPAQSQQT